KKLIRDYYRGKLYIYKDTESNAIDDVMKSMEECVRKYGVKLLVIDNLMMLDLKCNETEKNTAQTNLVNDLIKFASKFNVSVVLIAHPRKTQDMQSDIEMYDIAGSSNIINLAMRSIGLRRVTKREKEDYNNSFRNYNVILTIMKDRLLGKADKQIGLYYDVKSRRFFTDYDEFDHQYNWDKNVYDGKIPYPVEEEQRPFD
ncbi:MAG: AAA family ATPase, partial [Tyzzerella sp.]|nr:AAA family ATPase [Tyzzerella sp.]